MKILDSLADIDGGSLWEATDGGREDGNWVAIL